MKIFVSHAHEQADIADALAVALRQEGHEAFLDRDALKAGAAYHAAIRDAIVAADLFVFLVSPQALEPGSYALSELGVARERWPDPSRRVLPVVVAPTAFETIPPYLKAVTVLQPGGDAVAETVARVHGLAREATWRRRRVAGGAAAAAVAAVLVALGLLRGAGRDAAAGRCLLEARIVALPGAATLPRITTVETVHGDDRRAFIVGDGVAAVDVGPLTATDRRWIIETGGAAGRIGRAHRVDGCPSTALELGNDEPRFVLRLSPRS